MRPLAALLEELFALHGHQVTPEASLEGRSGTVYTVPILAELEGRAVVVGGQLDGSPVTSQDVAEFERTVADVGADAGVLVHTGPVEAAPPAGPVVLWSRATVVRLLGEAQVAQSLAEPAAPLPLEATSVGPAASALPALPDLLGMSVAEPADAVAQPTLEGFLELPPLGVDGPKPRSPPPAEDDDFHPFPPIAAQELPDLPAPEPLPESDLLPPVHPLADALPAVVAVRTLPRVAPVATPAAAPAVAVPSAAPPLPGRPAAFSSLVTSASAFAPALPSMVAPKGAPHPVASSAAALPSPLPPAFQSPPPAVPAPLPVQALPSPFPSASLPVLPVRVRVEDAKRRVREKLFSIRHVEVLLQPVHLYTYECDVLREGSLAADTMDGLVQVHGGDRTTLDLDPDQANPRAAGLLAPGHPYAVEERVLRVPEERARQLAVAHVTAKHTRAVSVRVPDHNNGLYYTEKRKVAPTSEQVRLLPLGVHLRPVWRLHGANGVVDVDAVDGREVMSEVRGGRTDALLLE